MNYLIGHNFLKAVLTLQSKACVPVVYAKFYFAHAKQAHIQQFPLMCKEICFSKYSFMHGKDVNLNSFRAGLLLICNNSCQLYGQYFTAVHVYSTEKDYMQAC